MKALIKSGAKTSHESYKKASFLAKNKKRRPILVFPFLSFIEPLNITFS
jgi:hypothetical protein